MKSIFDKEGADWPAQYASPDGKPLQKWDDVTTTLSDIDTSKLHYVKVPVNHIVIDFDLTDENGEKSLERNLKEANKWPETYAELSKSGKGLHLHYIYSGDPTFLKRTYADNIEIKVFTGKSSLRRQLTKCTKNKITTITGGLPLKEVGKSLDFDKIKDEKHLRNLIKKALNREVFPNTKPCMDFIKKVTDDAYEAGLVYDISDLRPRFISFAASSSHQAEYCLKLLDSIHFSSEIAPEPVPSEDPKIIFYDVEVFPNLFVVCYKVRGTKGKPIKMINPKPEDIEDLLKYNLVGFNCRRYDNHIMYARLLGYSEEQLFNLSQKIIENDKNAFFGQAYNLSYTDIYDYSAKKQSLKKWEIEMKIHHQELGLRWDQPVPEELWEKVAEYCCNDVIATEALFDYIYSDFEARKILAKIAGGTVNDTTNQLTTKLIFGNNRSPQGEFVYTDLSKQFPGYIYDHGKSIYMDEEVGEGGYVYSEPGMYTNVALLDIASMHPHSVIALNLFGDRYTARFKELVDARLAIKHRDFKKLNTLFNGAFSVFEGASDAELKNLSNALKIAINSVYGLTSASFPNAFRDPRNIDNIVAKRGALFMVNLKHEVQKRGFTVAHIKTDSIKIPNATPEIIEFVMEYGKKYGYTFEHEDTYERMCLVNDAVYIAKEANGQWTATGTQFQVPYVFKKLFSKEPIEFDDMCETKSVSSALYLDMNENLEPDEHNYIFIGKVGRFCPIKPGCGGGILYREKDEKYYAATGSKGYRWLESETVSILGKENDIDRSYYDKLVDQAIEDISKYGDYEWFVN